MNRIIEFERSDESTVIHRIITRTRASSARELGPRSPGVFSVDESTVVTHKPPPKTVSVQTEEKLPLSVKVFLAIAGLSAVILLLALAL